MAGIAQQSRPKTGVLLALSAMIMLYAVMIMGVYITSSRQGLSCPDWPLCPNGFALPSQKYFFEHMHRLMAVISAGLIFATAAYSSTRIKQARNTAFIAGIAVSIQILIGMLVVTTELEPLLVATHLSMGILLFAMTLMTFLTAYRMTSEKP